MPIDPLSILVGVPILGPIVAWQFLELKSMRTKLLEVVAEVVQSNATLKNAVERTGDRMESAIELLAEIVRNRKHE